MTSVAFVLRARALQPRREAELGGLRLRLEQATWLHEPMDHGDPVQLPASEEAPRPGQRRLAVWLTLFNPGGTPQEFSPRELVLIADDGQTWLPVGGEQAQRSQRVTHLLSLPLHFNVSTSVGGVRLEWVRGAERAALLSTRPPPSAGPPAGSARPWPRRVEALPPGTAAAGAALFHGRFACTTCHGDPTLPGSARIGPSLHDFAKTGATRIVGVSVAQYAYESLLVPGAFIAPECAGGQPCAQQSPMPLYGEVMTPQEMADLISYLLAQGGSP
jgi:mono/diheme cytochrome c family protein